MTESENTSSPEQKMTPLQALFKDYLDFVGLRPYYRTLADHEKAIGISDKLFSFFQQICQQEAQQAQAAPAVPVDSTPTITS